MNSAGSVGGRAALRWHVVLGSMLLAVYFASTALQVGQTLYYLQDATSLRMNSRLLDSLGRSLALSSAVALAASSLSFAAFHGFFRHRQSIPLMLIVLAFAPLLVPESTQALAISMAVGRVAAFGGYLPLYCALLSSVIPFCAAITILGLRSVPSQVWLTTYDLAVDRHRYFRRILFPLLWPTLGSCAVLAFLLSFNEFSRTNWLAPRELYSVFFASEVQAGGSGAVYFVSGAIQTAGLILLTFFAWKSSRIKTRR